jgi:hypothetical protein
MDLIEISPLNLKVGDEFRKPTLRGERKQHPWQTVAKFHTPCDGHHTHVVDIYKNEGCWDNVATVEVKVK